MPIKTRTSVIRQVPGKYETVEIDLDDPRQNEVTVKVAASGLCHSDDHVATGTSRSASTPTRAVTKARA